MKYKAFSLLNWYDGPTEFLVAEPDKDERIRAKLYYACWDHEDDDGVRIFALWSLPPRWHSAPGRTGYAGDQFSQPDAFVPEDEIDFEGLNE